MPYAFHLPTTSALSYSLFLQSHSHPSLILTASVQRSVVRDALKKHKRLPLPLQASNLTTVLAALQEYLPYVLALDAGLSSKPVSDEEIDVILAKDVEVEWRPCLAASSPGREVARVKGRGLDYEVCFVLTSLAYTYTLLARSQLHTLYAHTTPSPDQRVTAITTATKYLLQANSVHGYLFIRALDAQLPSAAVDVASSTQSALASLALSEATLLAVLKDDSYPAVVAQDRNPNDRDWMVKAPDIPKVRAHLFARLCVGAAEHAGKAHAVLSSPAIAKGDRIDESVLKYAKDLQRTAKAKACRFFGIDAELGGKTGEAIAWLLVGKKELGFKVNEDEGAAKIKGLAKFKKDWTERKEDKKIEKGVAWGSDAGLLEESRVIEWLEKKWNKENDLINSQRIPPLSSLLRIMPSGREIHSPQPYKLPSLDAGIVARMRAPLDREAEASVSLGDSDDSEKEDSSPVPGSFPRTSSNSEPTYF
ncbi:hypothetical protein MMC30_006380 [Trapelia coarctata]|nr:hypothetical protein [Trapelia coarctata]